MVAVVVAAIPGVSIANMGDTPPCDPAILGQANVFFDFSMEPHTGTIDQSACLSAKNYFADGDQRECYVFPGDEFEMVTDEMRSADAPFAGLVVKSPDASVLSGGRLFLDGERPISEKMFIEIDPKSGDSGF